MNAHIAEILEANPELKALAPAIEEGIEKARKQAQLEERAKQSELLTRRTKMIEDKATLRVSEAEKAAGLKFAELIEDVERFLNEAIESTKNVVAEGLKRDLRHDMRAIRQIRESFDYDRERKGQGNAKALKHLQTQIGELRKKHSNSEVTANKRIEGLESENARLRLHERAASITKGLSEATKRRVSRQIDEGRFASVSELRSAVSDMGSSTSAPTNLTESTARKPKAGEAVSTKTKKQKSSQEGGTHTSDGLPVGLDKFI